MRKTNIVLLLSMVVFCNASFGREILDEPLKEGIVKTDYKRDVKFKIDPNDLKEEKGIEFKFSGYKIYSINKKDLLNVLLDLNQF